MQMLVYKQSGSRTRHIYSARLFENPLFVQHYNNKKNKASIFSI
jgi:hypothetical protein